MIRSGEVFLKGRDGWLYFPNPQRVITTMRADEVLPALHEIESLVDANDWHAAGFLSYEAAPAFDDAMRVLPTQDFPLLWFGLYPGPINATPPSPAREPVIPNWNPTIEREKYNTAIETVKERIAEGKTYQVNYTMRLRSKFTEDAWDFFLRLAQTQNKYAAYVDTGRYVICSASPELFFELDGETISGRPMKGTVRRGRTTAEDGEQAEWLYGSIKNRAENVMIVDMIRNDLGRIAETGSVHVPELFTVEKYPTLFQMTSTVKAKTHASLSEIFRALFPCASITGAPKISTMKIIADLETTPRRIYTGSIGFISPGRKAQFNVAIRTALIDRETEEAEYGVGGGIVWDSTSADEYHEALLKARVLTERPKEFLLIETMLWSSDDGYFLREKHIERMADSAEYFGFEFSKEQMEKFLNETAKSFTSPQRVRILLGRTGKFTGEAKDLSQKKKQPFKVHLADKPVSSKDVFLFHKTTRREVYEDARRPYPECDDILLFNENDELTEFTIGNLVTDLDGELVTPPASCGLLAGTFRSHLLEKGEISERVITEDDLKNCRRIFLVNSVRKWVEVELI